MPERSPALSTQEWEARLGHGLRGLRLRQNLTQAEVARRANLDRTTVVRIERGEGGSIGSLIQIARVLGREEWLDALAPAAPAISPMDLLRARQQRETRPARQRARGGPAPTAARDSSAPDSSAPDSSVKR